MVRLIAAILVSQGMAVETGVLMQSQATTDSSLALAFEHETIGTTNRVEKMRQNTVAMEEEYKGILQRIVSSRSLNDPATGTPYLPNPGFLKIVEEQFESLNASMVEQRDANQKILNDHRDKCAECNSKRNTAFNATSGVKQLLTTMQWERGNHSECRVVEDEKIEDMETKCEEFDNITKKCEVDQNWYAHFGEDDVDGSVSEQGYGDGEKSALRLIVEKATACKLAVDVVTAKAEECDAAQITFRQAYCAYAKRLDTVCTSLDTCYSTAYSNWKQAYDSIKVLEEEQKAIWRMVGKVTCYLKLLINARETKPTTALVAGCSDREEKDNLVSLGNRPGATKQLNKDDSYLDIDYSPPDVKDNCDGDGRGYVNKLSKATPPTSFTPLVNSDDLGTDDRDHAKKLYRPGTNAPDDGPWYVAEFPASGTLTDHDKLYADKPCDDTTHESELSQEV